MFESLKHISLILAITILISISGAEAWENDSTARRNMLRQQVISFLQSGRSLQDLPVSHPLYPLKDTPALALVSYYLMEHDTGMLERFFPKIIPHVIERFSSSNTTRSGLLTGTVDGDSGNGIYLSPYLNGLACIEIHTLYLIASRIGLHTRALGYLEWSRELSETIDRTFYNYNRNYYFPLDRRGHYLFVYLPQQLIPLVMNRHLECDARAGIFNKCLSVKPVEQRPAAIDLFRNSLFHYRLIKNLLLIGGCSGTEDIIADLASSASVSSDNLESSSHIYLAEALSGKGKREKIFPEDWSTIGSLLHFVSVFENHDLYANDRIAALSSGVTDLRSSLSADYPDLESFRKSILLVNRLLIRISDINSYFKTPGKLWKITDEAKWRRLSPRDRNLLKNASAASLQELLDAKVLLSEKLASGAGITFDLHFPPESIPRTGIIDFKASLQSSDTIIDISNIYIQVDRNRWEAGNRAEVGPSRGGFSYTGSFTAAPYTRPGIMELPGYITFMSGNSRYEIHCRSFITLSDGYEALLNFPEGKRLKPDLPVKIILKYSADQPCQGLLEGSFCSPIVSSPSLPARFRVEAEDPSTTLPLTLKSAPSIPPGRYPVSLSLFLNGKPVAVFDESVVKPLNWLHLGPLPDDAVGPEHGCSYQDDFGKSYRSNGGRVVRWRRIPSGAVSDNGEVLLSRLESEENSGCLLYTLLKIEHDIKARITIDTGNETTVWLNGNIVFTGSGSGPMEIVERLRKGKNSLLIGSSWHQNPSPVLLEISDLSGLPLPQASNRLDEIVNRYATISAGPEKREFKSRDDKPREVTLVLTREDCSRISVIGSFNNWDPEATPMQRNGSGVWEATLLLEPGKYSYKFIIDNRIKITDPSSDLHESDGFGGTNSVLIVQ